MTSQSAIEQIAVVVDFDVATELERVAHIERVMGMVESPDADVQRITTACRSVDDTISVTEALSLIRGVVNSRVHGATPQRQRPRHD